MRLYSELLAPRSEIEIAKSLSRIDIDRELDRFRHTRFFRDRRNRVRLMRRDRAVRKGSFLTGTVSELLYSNPLVGTAKNTFTTEFQINDTAGMGDIALLPAMFFLPTRGRSQAIRVVARGLLSTTGTPTWLWTFRLNPTLTPANPPTGPSIAQNPAAITPGNATLTNTLWEAEFDAQMTIQGAPGNNSTIRGLGMVNWPGGGVALANQANLALFAGGASPGTVATFDWSLLNTLTVGSTCGTSNASNQIQILQLLIFGLN
jgi:hypothetical protein